MQAIQPTVGRKVWYRPNGQAHSLMVDYDERTPMDATIVYVHDSRTVNLLVHDHRGNPWPIEYVSVQLPAEDKRDGSYWEWMPYQVGQAKAVADVGKVGSGSPT